jgi:23S rRNA (cytosine1962-C5)-methyltransferase
VRARLKSKGKTPEKGKDEVLGELPPEKLVVREHGVPCEVHLSGGTNTGLFLDMREHRRGFARFVRDARVLNTFAYTGTLSVAAALGGAAHVTSVDLAAGTLAWAKTNFRLAGLDPDEPRFAFIESDVFRYVEQTAKSAQRFDVIVLDPPTVSGARASAWSQKNDYPDLIRAACALLPREGGHLWVSSNTHAGPGVRKYLQQAFERLPRTAAILEEGGLPPDFPTPLAAPELRYLDVCQVRVGAEL